MAEQSYHMIRRLKGLSPALATKVFLPTQVLCVTQRVAISRWHLTIEIAGVVAC